MHSYMVRYNQPRVEEALTQLKAGSAQTRAGGGGAAGGPADARRREPGATPQPRRSAWKADIGHCGWEGTPPALPDPGSS